MLPVLSTKDTVSILTVSLNEMMNPFVLLHDKPQKKKKKKKKERNLSGLKQQPFSQLSSERIIWNIPPGELGVVLSRPHCVSSYTCRMADHRLF